MLVEVRWKLFHVELEFPKQNLENDNHTLSLSLNKPRKQKQKFMLSSSLNNKPIKQQQNKNRTPVLIPISSSHLLSSNHFQSNRQQRQREGRMESGSDVILSHFQPQKPKNKTKNKTQNKYLNQS